jgi:hypothetical protein
MRLRIQPWFLIGVALALGGCTASAPAPQRGPSTARDPNAFHGDAAWAHLEALAAIGPREMGTDGSARAREYITAHLQALGLEVIQQVVTAKRDGDEPVTLHNVAASVPGESTDLLLVIAPYDTRGFESFENLGINDGGSGVAVSLELARLVAGRPLPYTTWFVFLEGEQPARGGTEAAHAGSRALAALLEQRGTIEQVRLALIINRVCDPDLHIARDLGSHRVHREAFFQAAQRLGFEEAFDARGGFEAPREGQSALTTTGLTRVVVLADTSFGGDEPPGPYADTADDDLAHCAAESLDVVGQVAIEGLRAIAQRLRRIDRFAESPIRATEVMRLEHLAETENEAEAPPESEASESEASEPESSETGASEAEDLESENSEPEGTAPPAAEPVPEPVPEPVEAP